MITVTQNALLALLVAFAILYALWTMYFFISENRRFRKENRETMLREQDRKKNKGDIVGKSQFVLKERIPVPQTAKEPDNEKDKGKENIFVPSDVPKEHSRIIPVGELDEVFGEVPPGEANPPLDIDCPMPEGPEPADEEEEYEALQVSGSSLAEGISFEQMGEAYRTVVHNPIITEEKKEETGRVLLHLKHTDMFEAMVSGEPEREDRVGGLIDSYLKAFHKRKAGGPGEDKPSAASVPKGFDVRNYV
ncbi:MAG: hypothetical protein A2W90_18285 [Bacteroidetes bacterium GWF2_42_66]|nr:MAG: hypothetical protein A2W92_11630 [Bacteroidetes bacterium GWA2_42_15]OFX98201.1 MAG: hypothetical protein A2W89_09775 [Bacteroidetes bacterium GWE2_42_39]OFY42586.1 MAG: hypothetical protein A2W90_18285 [Bacteroidetes bacterium GWF2_42_66]HBL74303.1 hypothetical protein [Prolixibacteraceae bacterium]HCU64073.1 hypothetical protein [Prolixibacteraceae bacterium]